MSLKDLLGNKGIEATVENLKAHHGALYAEVLTEARAGMVAEVENAKIAAHAQGMAEGSIKGAADETARMMGVYDRSEPGFEKEIRAMMADGTTTGAQAGDKLHMAGKVKRETAHQNMQNETTKAVSGSDQEAELAALEAAKKTAEEEEAKCKEGDFKTLCADYQKVNKSTKGEAIAAIAKSHSVAHQKYVDSLPRSKK